jgi:uncharacterized phiE125 gp8 family phage protein
LANAKITHDAEDLLIESFIPAARDIAEICQGGVDLIEKQWDLGLDCFPCGGIQLRTPLQSVTKIEYTDKDGVTTQLTQGTDYFVDTVRGLVLPAYGKSWPSFTPQPSSAVLIRFISGYPAEHPFWSNSGRRILQGMIVLCSEWYQHRIPIDVDSDSLPAPIRGLLSFGARERVI